MTAGARLAATIMALAPVLTIPVSIVFFHERVAWPTIVGAAVAVCGSALLFL